VYKERSEYWRDIENEVGGNTGHALAESIKQLYSFYDSRMITWLAELFDYERGGFYFSTPARDSDGYLPDIESTYGVLAGLVTLGMLHNYDDSFVKAMPAWFSKKIGNFIYSCQDENGYFYQKQWGKDVSDFRRARDLTSAVYLLKAYGIKPKYPLPLLDNNEKQKDYDIANAPEQFQSVENFRNYLAKYDLSHSSYSIGSDLFSQFPEIAAYSKMLNADLPGILIDWYNTNKRSDNGLWQEEINFYAVNGLHKISWTYNLAGAEIPDPEKCAESVWKVILSELPAEYVVDIYNPWHSLSELLKNIKKHQPKEKADIFLDSIRKKASAGIQRSLEKLAPFKLSDGSIAYYPGGGDGSGKMSPPNHRAASVNGAMCGSVSLTSSIYAALDLSSIEAPLYTDDDFQIFLETIEKKHK